MLIILDIIMEKKELEKIINQKTALQLYKKLLQGLMNIMDVHLKFKIIIILQNY